MSKVNIKRVALAAMFLALGVVLPMLTMQIKEIGDTLLPMHLPVMLCGLICGGPYGPLVGAVLPFLRSALFSMPPIYPNAVWMSAELATYGLVIGLLYRRGKNKSIPYLYFCLITAMLSGRIVWGVAKTVLLGLGGSGFTFGAFITGGFVDALLGIILQLILIPLIMGLLGKRANLS